MRIVDIVAICAILCIFGKRKPIGVVAICLRAARSLDWRHSKWRGFVLEIFLSDATMMRQIKMFFFNCILPRFSIQVTVLRGARCQRRHLDRAEPFAFDVATAVDTHRQTTRATVVVVSVVIVIVVLVIGAAVRLGRSRRIV